MVVQVMSMVFDVNLLTVNPPTRSCFAFFLGNAGPNDEPGGRGSTK